MNNLCADAETKQAVMVDLAKVSTMLVVSRLLSSQEQKVSFMDQSWSESSVHTLVGFVTYDVLVRKLVPNPFTDPTAAAVFNTWLKVGTMLVVSRLLSGQSLNDRAWQMASLYTLLGFTTYDVVTKRLLPNTFKDETTRAVFDDTLAFGTMFVVSQLLAGNPLNERWMRDSAYTLAGFAAYNYGTKPLLKL